MKTIDVITSRLLLMFPEIILEISGKFSEILNSLQTVLVVK